MKIRHNFNFLQEKEFEKRFLNKLLFVIVLITIDMSVTGTIYDNMPSVSYSN